MFQQPNLPPGLSLPLALKKAQKRDPNTTSNKLKTAYCIGWNKFGKSRQLRKCKVYLQIQVRGCCCQLAAAGQRKRTEDCLKCNSLLVAVVQRMPSSHAPRVELIEKTEMVLLLLSHFSRVRLCVTP